MNRGCVHVVSILASYSDGSTSSPAEVYSFFVKYVVEKNKTKQKDARLGPFKKTPGLDSIPLDTI